MKKRVTGSDSSDGRKVSVTNKKVMNEFGMDVRKFSVGQGANSVLMVEPSAGDGRWAKFEFGGIFH